MFPMAEHCTPPGKVTQAPPALCLTPNLFSPGCSGAVAAQAMPSRAESQPGDVSPHRWKAERYLRGIYTLNF